MFSMSLTLAVVDFAVVVGNLCVLYVIVSQKNLHSSTNTLVLSLTISDLLLGVLILPFAIVQARKLVEEHTESWPFSDVACRIWLSLDVWLSTASIYNLLAISFDRYMAVRQPLKYTIISSTRVVRLLTALVWMCSLVLAIGLFALAPDVINHGQCMPTTLPSLYIVFSACASFLGPAIVMVVLNLRIFCTVLSTSRSTTVVVKDGTSLRVHRGRRRSKKTPELSDDKRAEETSLKDAACLSGRSEDRIIEEQPTLQTFLSQTIVFGVTETKKTTLLSHITQRKLVRRSLRTELRVARTTAVVVAAFVVCWIPFTTIYCLQAYSVCMVSDGCVPNWLYLIAFWLGYSNSAINPILYAAFSREIRAAFRRILVRAVRRKHVFT